MRLIIPVRIAWGLCLLGVGGSVSGQEPIISRTYVTEDAARDVEPHTLALAVNGEHRILVAYMKYDAAPAGLRIHVTRGSASSSAVWNLPLPMPVETNAYATSGDPWLAGDTNDLQRVYCLGVLYPADVTTARTAIALWRSLDGGVTWLAPTVIAEASTAAIPRAHLDKPVIVARPGGGAFVAYVRIPHDANGMASTPRRNEIHVAAITPDGRPGLPAEVRPGAQEERGDVGGPQLVAAAAGLHLIWVSYEQPPSELPEIRSSTSTDGGATWSPRSVVGRGDLYQQNSGFFENQGCFRVITLPIAGFAPGISIAGFAQGISIPGQIGVVWHDKENRLRYNHATDGDSLIWGAPVTFPAPGPDVQPSLGLDRTGNFVVTWYHVTGSAACPTYVPYWTRLTPSGSVLGPSAALFLTASDSSQIPGSGVLNGFIGDYHGVSAIATSFRGPFGTVISESVFMASVAVRWGPSGSHADIAIDTLSTTVRPGIDPLCPIICCRCQPPGYLGPCLGCGGGPGNDVCGPCE